LLGLIILASACARRDMRGLWMLTQTLGEEVSEIRLEFYGYSGSGEIISNDGTVSGEYHFSFNHDLMFTMHFPSGKEGWLDKAIYHGGFDSKDEMSGTFDYYAAFSDGEILHGSWSANRLSDSILEKIYLSEYYRILGAFGVY